MTDISFSTTALFLGVVTGVVLLIAIISVYAPFTPAQDPHSDHGHKMVDLIVKVVNATASGTAVEGDRVFITIYHGEQQMASIEAVVDSAGTTVVGNVKYIDLNTVEVTFSAPFSGEAFCN